MEKNDDALLQKILYAGLGLAAEATETVQKKVDQLIKDKKLTKEEGKKIIDTLVKNFDQKKEKYEKNLKELINRNIEKFKFAKKSDLENLEQKLKELQERINKLEGK